MLYKPAKERLWDTWIVNDNNRYYLFYIRVSENGTRWDGISLAISDDLIHWHEHGTVLKKDDDAIWLGTGMVMKFHDRYVMNYSQEKPAGEQKVFFAESLDLISWKKIENVVFEPDDIIYLKSNDKIADSYPRWDSLGIVNPLNPNRSKPYYAFFTSDSAEFEYSGKRGALGFCESNDGINWKHLPPATIKKDIVPAFEVPEHIEFDGNHYVIFCTSSKLGYRFDKRAKYVSGGTYYVFSENLAGPYDFTEHDPMLVGSRDVDNVTMGSVGRVIYEEGKVLFYHIWGDPIADGWVGLVKELREVSKGELQLYYFNRNDRLKNLNATKSMNQIEFKPTKQIGKLLPVDWKVKENAVEFKNLGSSGMLISDYLGIVNNAEGLGDGVFIEGHIKIDNGLGAGIVLETESKQQVCIFLNIRDQSLDFCKVVNGFCSNLVLEEIMTKSNKVLMNNEFDIKLISRKYFVEVYLNDIYISGLRLTEKFNNDKYGFYVEDSEGKFSNFDIYQLK